MQLFFSQSPHVRSNNSTRKIMLSVAIALAPSSIAGIVFFGLPAVLMLLTAVISSIGAEVVYELCVGKKFKTIFEDMDYSSLVTGLILALIMPATYHLYVVALASVFAIVVVKMFFGGTGNNLVNPAASGRIFAFISFSAILDSFVKPSIGAIKNVVLTGPSAGGTVVTGATSLKNFLAGGNSLSTIDLLLGTGVAGCIGETCKIAILIGAIYLAIKKIIDIKLPIFALLLAGITGVALNEFDFGAFLPTVLSGGLFFACFFMATDFVTNPRTTLGRYVFFAGFAILTVVLRQFSGYETASFALLIMNLIVPLIDKITINKPFGYKKPQKEAK